MSMAVIYHGEFMAIILSIKAIETFVVSIDIFPSYLLNSMKPSPDYIYKVCSKAYIFYFTII